MSAAPTIPASSARSTPMTADRRRARPLQDRLMTTTEEKNPKRCARSPKCSIPASKPIVEPFPETEKEFAEIVGRAPPARPGRSRRQARDQRLYRPALRARTSCAAWNASISSSTANGATCRSSRCRSSRIGIAGCGGSERPTRRDRGHRLRQPDAQRRRRRPARCCGRLRARAATAAKVSCSMPAPTASR